MTKLNMYITLPGTANQAIELYKRVFQTEPTMVSTFKDLPPSQETPPLSEQAQQRILHASFQVGQDTLMLSDAPEGQDHTVIMGSQLHLSLHPDSKEEADRQFALLSEGGSINMPLAMQFWGDYYGMCQDKFGVRWMVNYHKA